MEALVKTTARSYWDYRCFLAWSSLLLPVAMFVALMVALGCNQPKHLGRAASSWAVDLGAEDDYRRRAACEAFAAMPSEMAASELQVVAQRLEDYDPLVQGYCADALASIGEASMPLLVAYLQGGDPERRLVAASTALRIDPGHADARKVLMMAFTGLGNAALSKRAGGAVRRLGGAMVPELVAMLSHNFDEQRELAIATLAALGDQAAAATAALSSAVREDKQWKLRRAAVGALAEVANAEDAVPVLRAALEDEHEEVRIKAAVMLKYVGARPAPTGNQVISPDEDDDEREDQDDGGDQQQPSGTDAVQARVNPLAQPVRQKASQLSITSQLDDGDDGDE